jgi:branched-chain amino acid transport system substrate-binding protein
MGKKKITVMSEDTVAGHSFLDAFIKGFKDAGGQVIQEQYSAWPCQDFAPYLSQLKDADAVVAWYEGQDSIIFLNQFHEYGIRKRMPLIAPFHGAFVQLNILGALRPEASAALIGERGPTEYTSLLPSAVNKRFVEAYNKKMGFLPGEGDAIAYESVQVALKALEATGGDTNPDKLRDAIYKLNIEVPSGNVSFDKETNFAIRNMYIFEICKVDGKFNWCPIYVYEKVPAPGYPTPPGKSMGK